MNLIKKILNKLPYVRGLYRRDKLYNDNAFFPPGHFYSVIPNLEDIKNDEQRIWKYRDEISIDGVNLNIERQKELLKKFSDYYSVIPFKDNLYGNLRYHFKNSFYSYTDGIILYGMLRHLQPKNIIEVGSGYSSALILDVNDIFFDGEMNLVFIEPHTDRLNKLISKGDKESITILERRVQDVDLGYFKKLNKNDILFIDSTHVSKCGSDLNFLLFDVLPMLNEGVYIHFHDIFYPFEYPKEWVFKGYNWNENYLLRAFLMNNSNYTIQVFADYLHLHHKNVYSEMPIACKNTGGNLWLKKEIS